jgi:hypothetical protein
MFHTFHQVSRFFDGISMTKFCIPANKNHPKNSSINFNLLIYKLLYNYIEFLIGCKEKLSAQRRANEE